MSALVSPRVPTPTRRERALATRLRITRAAYTLFSERGYTDTTMADIAAAAGVAVQTVYFTFHTKGELLSRAFDLAVMGEDGPLPPEQQAWYARMTAEPDLAAALRHLVTGVGTINVRAMPLDTFVRAEAESDPETARVWAYHERLRADAHRTILEILVTKAPLREDITPERATHLLLFYLGSDAYRPLVRDFGWTHEEWIDWTVAAIAGQVFAAGSTGRGR